jgi:hypothetical protein
MPFACNIDKKGRIARLIYGLTFLAAGGLLALGWALHSASPMRWTVAGGCAVAGAFGIFEAVRGWCVMRAIGVKTPL